DIGGGTTKLAVVDRGRVLATAALHVGGRLIAVDGDTVTRIEPGGRKHAASIGLDLDLGSQVGSADLDGIASAMADLVIAAVRGEPARSEERRVGEEWRSPLSAYHFNT